MLLRFHHLSFYQSPFLLSLAFYMGLSILAHIRPTLPGWLRRGNIWRSIYLRIDSHGKQTRLLCWDCTWTRQMSGLMGWYECTILASLVNLSRNHCTEHTSFYLICHHSIISMFHVNFPHQNNIIHLQSSQPGRAHSLGHMNRTNSCLSFLELLIWCTPCVVESYEVAPGILVGFH